MTLHKRRTSLAAGGLVLALGLAACGGGDDNESSSSQSQSPAAGAKGGTVKILNQSDFEHLDPQRNYVTNSGNTGRLITRTLTIVKETTGKDPEIIGDLASKWESADNNQTWTFTLKDGLKYEDGTAVTAKDVKYGVERSFSPDLAEGSPYGRQYLVGAEGYKGPYVGGNNGGLGLDSIQAPDDKTIVFKLNQPVADFMWTASMFTFSPVPQAKDTKTEYDNHPISTGPYMIKDYVRGQSMTLVRNPNWSQSTDEYRTALPDQFDFSFGQDAAVVDQRLLANAAADQNATTQDVTVQNQSLPKITQPNVADRIIKGPSICVRYVAMNFLKPAMQNVKVRQAIEFAVNKKDFQTAYGGPLFGPVVSSVIPPATAGYKPVEDYKAPETGDPEKAKQLLTEAGVSNLSVTLAAADTQRASAAAVAVQNSLGLAGIKVTIKKIPGDNYYTTIQNNAQAPELMLAGWCADWPSSSAILPPILGPDNLLAPKGPNTNNYSRYNSDTANAEMKRISTEVTDPDQAASDWANVNEQIMKDAPLVPTINDGGVYATGSKITNAEITPTFGGEIDMVKIGIKQ
jgi:peptide/nickel transport system substrate-binding protein